MTQGSILKGDRRRSAQEGSEECPETDREEYRPSPGRVIPSERRVYLIGEEISKSSSGTPNGCIDWDRA